MVKALDAQAEQRLCVHTQIYKCGVGLGSPPTLALEDGSVGFTEQAGCCG